MIHLYCVVDRPEAALAAIGDQVPDSRLVRSCRVAGVAGVAGVVHGADLPTDGPALAEHDRLLRRMMEVSTVVPFRYGTVLADAADAAEELDTRAEMFERLLDRLRGQVELAVRARAAAPRAQDGVRPGGGTGGPVTGRAYLRALGARSSLGPLEALHRALAAEATASRLAVDGPGGPGAVVGTGSAVGDAGSVGIKASYLIPAEAVEDFRCRLTACVTGAAGIEGVSLTGPWPPYSFVGPDMLDESDQTRTAFPELSGAAHG